MNIRLLPPPFFWACCNTQRTWSLWTSAKDWARTKTDEVRVATLQFCPFQLQPIIPPTQRQAKLFAPFLWQLVRKSLLLEVEGYADSSPCPEFLQPPCLKAIFFFSLSLTMPCRNVNIIELDSLGFYLLMALLWSFKTPRRGMVLLTNMQWIFQLP